jgi:5-methylcytosine-specific restriction endonuclease McrA
VSWSNGSKWIRPTTRLAIYIRDGFSCVYCERSIEDDAECLLSLDHVVPHARGGSHLPSNLLTACLRCNSKRGSKSIQRFVHSLWTTENAMSILARARARVRRKIPRQQAREMIAQRQRRDDA